MPKILIVKLGALGDLVLSLVMLTGLRKKYPEAQITWLVGSAGRSLLEAVVGIDRLVVIDDRALLRGTLFQRLRVVAKIYRSLWTDTFDLIVTAHPDHRYHLLTRFLRSKNRLAFDRETFRPNPLYGRSLESEHLRLVTGCDDYRLEEGQFPPLVIKEHYHLETSLSGKRRVLLAPGGARNVLAENPMRRWPIEHYVTLARHLTERGFEVILSGSSSDQWVEPYFKGIAVRSLIGALSIQQLLDLLRQVDLLVTHDTGTMHFGVLMKTPLLALFGPTAPYQFIASRHLREGGSVEAIWGGASLPCRPCYDGKNYAPCKRNLCLESVFPESILQRIIQKFA